MQVEIEKCNCGDSICTKHRISTPSNIGGLFRKEDAEHIKMCVEMHDELVETVKKVEQAIKKGLICP